MRTFTIAVAIAGLAAGSADAQVARSGGQSQWQGRGTAGQWQGGATSGQWQRQGAGGQWQGGQRQGGQWQGGQWQGGQQQQQRSSTTIVGRDPRTWGPGNQPGRPGHGWGSGWGGGYVGGRWYAGTRAPGGWGAYRRPHRGWQMPHYWRAPEYRIQDYGLFGLSVPPQGYGWSRYYDDAVLVDHDGRVYDTVGGIDWRRADQPYATGYGYPSQGYWNAPGPDYGPGDDDYGDDYGFGGQGGQAYAGDGYAYAEGGAGGGVIYAPPQQAYGYQGYGHGGYLPGASATATFEFDMQDRRPETTTTTTTTTTEEWVSEPVVTERVVYKQARPKVVYRTIVKKVPYRAPVKKWRPKPQPACADPCECGTVCGS